MSFLDVLCTCKDDGRRLVYEELNCLDIRHNPNAICNKSERFLFSVEYRIVLK